ncbi:hypothetical protein ACIRBZ_10545 [Streptomyces sp. NPDC094038]|uniref:hypothetical protein n=1 Tax=Streptomyces sp. NPDC094038 TaxID=3366055 RepID=UPI00382C3F9A
MPDLIRRLALWLRLLLAPGTGKRRRTRYRPRPTAVPLARTAPAPEPPPAGLPRHRSPYGLATPLDGTASRLIRPYLLAHERHLAHERETALQKRRRLALVLAADFGIDLDRHLIGAPVGAAA